jgi:hypothetical protein
MAIIMKIWSQWAPESDHSQRCLMLDCVPRWQSEHWRSSTHAPSTCKSDPWLHSPTPLKATLGCATLHSALAFTVPTQLLASASSGPPARATRTPAIATSHSQRHLASPEPLDSYPVEPCVRRLTDQLRQSIAIRSTCSNFDHKQAGRARWTRVWLHWDRRAHL